MEKEKQGLLGRMDRRNMIKGLATVPFLGAFAIAWWRKRKKDHYLQHSLLKELNMDASAPYVPPSPDKDKTIRLGIIGYGGRGSHLVRGAGTDPGMERGCTGQSR